MFERFHLFLGGLLFGILGTKTNKYGRDIIVLLGYVIHMVAFFLVFINLPEESPIRSSGTATYITPRYVPSLNTYLCYNNVILLG